MTVWLTRPRTDSDLLAVELEAHGIPTMIAPVMQIARRKVVLPEKPEALVMTSRHAAHALPDAWRDLPVYCVGKATANAVRAYGYTHLIIGEHDAMDLLPRMKEKRFVYFSGESITVDIVGLLALQGSLVERVVVYDAVPERRFPDALRRALEAREISGVVFFSARTAQIAASLMKHEEFTASAPQIDAYCLSLPVAEAAVALAWRSLQVSHLPTRAAMIAMIAGHAQAVAS